MPGSYSPDCRCDRALRSTTDVPRRREFGISAIRSACRTRVSRSSGDASPKTSTSEAIPPETAGSPSKWPSTVTATRVRLMPIRAASRNRSFEMQPATARCSSWPPLKPRPPPPPSSGRSTTSVCGPDHPIAVLSPSRLDVCTLNMPTKDTWGHSSGGRREAQLPTPLTWCTPLAPRTRCVERDRSRSRPHQVRCELLDAATTFARPPAHQITGSGALMRLEVSRHAVEVATERQAAGAKD